MIKFLALGLILSSCSLVPSYKAEEQNYCERTAVSTVCPGYAYRETPLDWIRKTTKEYQK